MAGASSSSPAWSQCRSRGWAGQPSRAAALTGVSLLAGPRAVASSACSRGIPPASQIFQTVCAETGVPCSVRMRAIWVTDRRRARRLITFSRSGPVALTGPLGPGRASANRRIRPDRTSVAIWCTLAVEYPNWSATRVAGQSSTKYARMASYRRWAEPDGWVKNSAPARIRFLN